MEQNRSLPFALLIAAHGERQANADNDGVARLADRLARAGVAAEVGFGFIKGAPSVDAGIRALSSRHVVVYPLFLANGYFTRVVLPQLVQQAIHENAARTVSILPPLGLEPALADLIADEAAAAAHSRALSPSETTVVLLAHGSTNDKASRIAAERLANRVRQRQSFQNTRAALLEEAPSLVEAIAPTCGPIIVVGLFAGEGRHGSEDAKCLIAELGRDNIFMVGPIGMFRGIEAIIAEAVRRHVLAGFQGPNCGASLL